MSTGRIYTGAEALAQRKATLSVCKDCGWAWDFERERRRCEACNGATVLLARHPIVADLAASVAHWEARAIAAEAERERLLPRKGEHVNELYACVARVLSRLGVQDRGGDPLEALESWADEEHARSLAETDARNAAIAHAAELEAALREARAGLDNAVATVARLRGELAAERAARSRAETAMDERGLRLVAVTRERDALRDAVEGSTVPPTFEEAQAHHAAGGRWLIAHRHEGRNLVYVLDHDVADVMAQARSPEPTLWVALTGTGRPCARPVVTEVPRG